MRKLFQDAVARNREVDEALKAGALQNATACAAMRVEEAIVERDNLRPLEIAALAKEMRALEPLIRNYGSGGDAEQPHPTAPPPFSGSETVREATTRH